MRGLKINELRSQNVSWSRKVSNYNKLRLNKQKQAEKRITVILNTNLNAFTMSFSYSKNKRYANLYATTSSGTSKSCWLTLCNLGPIRIAVFLYQLRFLIYHQFLGIWPATGIEGGTRTFLPWVIALLTNHETQWKVGQNNGKTGKTEDQGACVCLLTFENCFVLLVAVVLLHVVYDRFHCFSKGSTYES